MHDRTSTEDETAQGKDDTSKSRKPGLAGATLIGLALGVLCGLFFGEATAPLQVLGDAFVGLLQMTVLPYVVLSLVGGIGRLSLGRGRGILASTVLILLGLWALALLSVLIVPMSLPQQTTASFFSSSTVTPSPGVDFFELFIPANPFWSLARSKVPAVVLFCILSGVAFMGVRGKEEVQRTIDVLAQVMSRVTALVVKASPAGVFFIAAAAAGTMGLQDLSRIQGYLVVSTLVTLGLGMGVLPALVSVMTPFSYRDIAPLLRSSMVLAFATGKTLVVLPMLTDGIKDLFKRKGYTDDDAASVIEVLIPLGYSFPHLGRLLTTSFIPFAAWYVGAPLRPEQYPLLLGASLFAHFSSASVAVPFLLDLMHLPSDLFQLFLVIGLLAGRLADAVAASYLLTLAVLGACAVIGILHVRWRRAVAVLAASVMLASLAVAGSRLYIAKTSGAAPDMSQVLSSMQLREHPVPAVLVEPEPNPVVLRAGQSRLDRALDRGVIRIGFVEDSLPFAFENNRGQLVGLDIDLCHELAHDLGVSIEFVPVKSDLDLEHLLEDDVFDLAVGGLYGTVDRARKMRFSQPYSTVSMAFIVPDHRDRDFVSLKRMAKIDDLTIGVFDDGPFTMRLRDVLPDVRVVSLADPRDFFEQAGSAVGVDALLFNAEAGSAWTLRYPSYQVATPLHRKVSIPLVLPYAKSDDPATGEFLDDWVMLRQSDGSIDQLFEYWILGKGAESHEPRWSIVREVLHLTD